MKTTVLLKEAGKESGGIFCLREMPSKLQFALKQSPLHLLLLPFMSMLTNKRALITGVASKLSIATGVAEAMHREGAELAFTYQNEKLQSRVQDCAKKLGDADAQRCFACDLTQDDQIDALAQSLQRVWPEGFDIVVHAVAFAPRYALEGSYLHVTDRKAFTTALDISAYSFTGLVSALNSQLRNGASVLTLSYLGAVLTMPNYNVMGVAKAALESSVRYLARGLGEENKRVNAISAGPIRTLASSGISDFRSMLEYNASRTPLKRNITTHEVGNAAAFLGSDLASGITGQVIYVDAGFNTTAS